MHCELVNMQRKSGTAKFGNVLFLPFKFLPFKLLFASRRRTSNFEFTSHPGRWSDTTVDDFNSRSTIQWYVEDEQD